MDYRVIRIALCAMGVLGLGCGGGSGSNNNGTGGGIGTGGGTGGTSGQQCLPNATCLACIGQSCDSQATAVFGSGYRTGNYHGGICPNLMTCACAINNGNMDTCAQLGGANCTTAFANLNSCMDKVSCGSACDGNSHENLGLTVNGNSMNFGNTDVGSTQSRCMVVTGSNASAVYPTISNDTGCTVEGCSFTSVPLSCDHPSSCKACVIFTPQFADYVSATLNITSDISVSLTGLGTTSASTSTGGTIIPTGFGGATGFGGTTSASGVGGITSSGGTTIVSGTGGIISTGGSSEQTTSETVTFVNGVGKGVMTGWGWISSGVPDVVTDPLCSGAVINNSAPCSIQPSWNSPSALCMTGAIPPLPETPTQLDYDSNWGMEIGVSSGGNPAVPIGKTYSTIALSVTGSPVTGLRVQLHRSGDPSGTNYCAPFTNTPIPFTDFNTACWDGSGKQFTLADVPLITDVMLYVPSQKRAIIVTNLCITSITFSGQ